MADLIFERDCVVQSLTLMEHKPYPGGEEEKAAGSFEGDCSAEQNNRRSTPHATVTKAGRSFAAVRQEMVTSVKNFLIEKMDVEQEENVHAMLAFARSENADEMIKSGRKIVEHLFGTDSVSDDIIGFFCSQGARTIPPNESVGATLYALLRNTRPSSVLNKLIQSFLIASPHSMMTERVISCHTELKNDLRASLSRETVNDRLCIALNSRGTAFFDPRPSVAKFLCQKDRRMKVPDAGLYQERECVKTFFNRF